MIMHDKNINSLIFRKSYSSESENHSIVETGKDLSKSSDSTHCSSRDSPESHTVIF